MAGDRSREFFTVAQAAEMLGVSVSTVWRWIDSRRLPAFRLGPKAIRIQRQDIEAAIRPIDTHGAASGLAPGANSVPTITPLTEEERVRGLAALKDAADSRHRMRVRRHGKVLPSSAGLIRSEREARSRRV